MHVHTVCDRTEYELDHTFEERERLLNLANSIVFGVLIYQRRPHSSPYGWLRLKVHLVNVLVERIEVHDVEYCSKSKGQSLAP